MPEFRIRDFSGGMIDKIEDHLLPENASPDLSNMIATEFGSIKKRPGQALLNSSDTSLGSAVLGLHAFYSTNGNRYIVAAANGSVSYWDTATTAFVEIKGSLSSTADYYFTVCHTTLGKDAIVVANGTDAPFMWDGTTDAVFSSSDCPGDGQFPTYHKDKLFMVSNADPSTILWSEEFAVDTWTATNLWRVKDGDGDVITALVPFLGELVIFKRYSIHSLRGNNLTDFRLDEIVPDKGAVVQKAIARKGNYLYFVADDGLYAYNGLRVVNIIQDALPNLWATVNKQYLSGSAVGTWDKYVWFSLPETTSVYNNMVLLYETPADGAIGGKWWVLRGITASHFLQFTNGTELVFYAGDATTNGYIVQQWTTNVDDYGTNIDAYWYGKVFDVNYPDRKKKFGRVFTIDDPTTASLDVTLQAKLDYNSTPTTLTEQTTDDVMIRSFVFPSSENTGRYMQPKVTHSSSLGCELRGLTFQYKTQVVPR
jgi:hypothetical protein